MLNKKACRIISEKVRKSNLIIIILWIIYQVDDLIEFESLFFNLESQWSWSLYT